MATSKPVEPPDTAERPKFPPVFIALAAATIGLVGVAAWFAGYQYARLRTQQLVSDLGDARQTSTKLRVRLGEQESELQKLRSAPAASGHESAAQTDAMRRQILRLQAELNSFQATSDRDRKTRDTNERLLDMLSVPGARLYAFHGSESAPNALAYMLLIENKSLVFVAAHLPPASPGREYQLWLNRKSDPRIVSAGTFMPDEEERAVVRFSENDLVKDLVSVTATQEPATGSETPSGAEIFRTTTEP